MMVVFRFIKYISDRPDKACGRSRQFFRLFVFGVTCGWMLAGAWPVWAQNGYVWKNVAIGGSQALVTGVIADHSGLVCIRTDVGGAYRWSRSSSTWVPLVDWLAFTNREFYQCESLAIDPNNSNVLYYAGGRLKTQWLPGVIFKSTNGGTTWSQLNFTNAPMGGNADRRWAGERLAVDPGNSSVVLFGSRTNGLWRSTNGGTNWAKVASIPKATNSSDIYGVQSVAFNPAGNGIVYAAVSTNGVYQSSDHGATFTTIGGSANPRRLQVATNGTLWFTHSSGVSKYAGSAWTTYEPGGAANVCCGLAINPLNSLDVLVATGECFGTISIYRTVNGGTNWTQKTETYTSPVTWFSNWHALFSVSFAFDPLNTNVVWKCQSSTTNINNYNGSSAGVHWVDQEAGHEQDVMNCLISPPSGAYELLTGSWDDDGFAFTNLDVYPNNQLGVVGSWNGHTWGMAYERTNPKNMLRIGAQTYYGGATLNVCRSTDGGGTWNRLSNFPTTNFPAVGAVSATNPNNMVVIGSRLYSSDSTGNSWPSSLTNVTPWLYSTNGGTNWVVITGLPTPPAYAGQSVFYLNLAADGTNGNKFYYCDRVSSGLGKIYMSTNGGQTFPVINNGPLNNNQGSYYMFKARPDVEGYLWFSVDNDSPNVISTRNSAIEGLYHSTNGGTNWSKLATVDRTLAFGFGLPAIKGGPATLFMFGRTNGSTSDCIYRSPDLGQTWQNIQSPTNLLGDTPQWIEGSWQTTNRVFVGMQGRGVFYGTFVPPALYTLVVTNGSGGGSYTNGANVTITASNAPTGIAFANWVVNAGNPTIANANTASTTLTMPATNVSVTASCEGLTITGVGVTNGFGFTITGGLDNRTNQVTVYVSTNLVNWLSLTNLTLTNNVIYFKDPQWTNQRSSFYRLQFYLIP